MSRHSREDSFETINNNIAQALANEDHSRFDKIASGIDLMFKTYTYTAGQQRKIYTELTGRQSLEIVPLRDERRRYVPEFETTELTIHLQPDFMRHAKSSVLLQSWASPYLRRVSGRTAKGYFSKLESEPIKKTVDEVKSYGYDFLGLIREDSVHQILEKEDRFGYMKDYMMIGAQEAQHLGMGIMPITQIAYEAEPHIAMKNLFKLHHAARKGGQPRALTVLPDELWMDFGTIQQDIMSNVAEKTMQDGFGDKNSSVILGQRAVRFDDDQWLTYDGTSVGGNSKWDGGTPEDLAIFGYDITGTLTEQAAKIVAYGLGSMGATWVAVAKHSFKRVMLYAPINYYGGAYLDETDMKTRVQYENGFVIVNTSEKLAYLAHNQYAVTAMDVWV